MYAGPIHPKCHVMCYQHLTPVVLVVPVVVS